MLPDTEEVHLNYFMYELAVWPIIFTAHIVRGVVMEWLHME